jgi:pyruvate/2-oxoglutarate dehydrogenase complex dihydrolipoamide dehydrogenase (E3) component
MTEAEVRKTCKPALISTMAMKDVMRAYERGETKGFMKILVDRDSKQILGASFLGVEGDEVIHCVLDIMYAKAPYTVIQRAMHIHHYSDYDGSAQAAVMIGAVLRRGKRKSERIL